MIVAKQIDRCVGVGNKPSQFNLIAGGCIEQSSIEAVVFLRKADIDTSCRFAFGHNPRACVKDGGAVDGQPLPQPDQSLTLQRWNCPIRHRPDVEQQIAIFAHNIDKGSHQVFQCEILFGPFDPIIAKRSADAAARFPFLGANFAKGGIFRCLKVEVVVTDNASLIHLEFLGKAIVDHAFRQLVVVFGKEHIQISCGGIGDIVPQQHCTVPINELAPMMVSIFHIFGHLRYGSLDVGNMLDHFFVKGPI